MTLTREYFGPALDVRPGATREVGILVHATFSSPSGPIRASRDVGCLTSESFVRVMRNWNEAAPDTKIEILLHVFDAFQKGAKA